MKRLTAWLDGMQEKFPQIEGATMEQDAWIEAVEKRREKINRVRCPYGAGEILEGVHHHIGHFFASRVPDAKP